MITLDALYAIFLQHRLVTTDTRNCPDGSIFFALKGARFNGNQFALQALQAGCAYAVVDEPVGENDSRILYVENVLETLQALARFHRRQLSIPVIGITGTNGKTTTKELTAAALGSKYRVLATSGNLNNHIGVPLTLLSICPEHEIAVVEMGANHPGEITFLTAIVEPDYGIITNVGKAHLEGFGSFEGVVRTKSELYDFLRKHHRPIFLRAEDDVLAEKAEGMAQIRYGTSEALYVQGSLRACNPTLSFSFVYAGKEQEVQTQLVGAYNFANALAATAIALYFDVKPEAVAAAIAAYTPQNKRSQLIKTEKNTLIVDAYNANPTSMRAALENFFSLEASPKAVILGDMRELGTESAAEHEKIVSLLAEKMPERILLAGTEFSAIAKTGDCFPDTDALIASIEKEPLSGYLILVKGSNGMHLERVLPFL